MTYKFEKKESYSHEEIQSLIANFVKIETEKVKPKEKTQEELDLETRLTELSKREKALNLKENGLPTELAELLKDDVDFTKIADIFKKSNGYVPADHKKTDGLTKAKFETLTYAEQAKLFAENPELTKTLI